MTLSVTPLGRRPIQCYRCQAFGYVSARCDSEMDRSRCCYRCSKEGHKSVDCTVSPHCIPCSVAGKPANHRAGSGGCARPFVPPRKNTGNREDGLLKRHQVLGRLDGGSTLGSPMLTGVSSRKGIRGTSVDADGLPPELQGPMEPLSP